MGILNTKKAFTMAEVILVMTILGIIATIMITTLKPAQFKDKGLEIMARKVLSEIDTAVTQILINDTLGGNLGLLKHPDCDYTVPFPLGWFNGLPDSCTAGAPYVLSKIFRKYLTTTRQEVSNTSFCGKNAETAFYLKDGACVGIGTVYTIGSQVDTLFPDETLPIKLELDSVGGNSKRSDYFGAIYVDTNGDEEPNVFGKDRFTWALGPSGIVYDE